MQPNLWFYANHKQMQMAAASLVVFGAEVFNRAKLVKDIVQLKAILNELDKQNINALSQPTIG